MERKRLCSTAVARIFGILALGTLIIPPGSQAFMFTGIDVLGGTWTRLVGINNEGRMVGDYIDANGILHGVLFNRNVISTIDVPGAAGTSALGINERGQIVGYYVEADSTWHGFLLEGGVFTTIDPPAAASAEAVGINDAGTIVGDYVDANGAYHGFIYENSTYSSIDFPGASGTSLIKINDPGQMVGYYFVSGTYHGLLVNADHSMTTFDVRYETDITTPTDINNRGEIVGLYWDQNGFEHGYVYINGNFTQIDAPGTGTEPFGMNERREIVGVYSDTTALHGFVTGYQFIPLPGKID
jgi:probable HAF family extracellular repeat protein